MKVLVAGYGSIGKRHSNILSEMGCEVSVVSGRNINHAPLYKTVAAALEAEKPEYIVIANRTIDRYTSVLDLAKLGFRGYDMNASIYAWQCDALFQGDSIFLNDTALFIMPEERSIDIDSELDFQWVEFLMSRSHQK